VLYDQVDGFLGSLEECLSDEMGALYFKKFCEEQFSVENFLFHEAVMRYRACQSHSQRVRIGEDIIAQFVEIGSAKEVNLAYATRGRILTIVNLVKKMNENKDKYQQALLRSKRKKDNRNHDHSNVSSSGIMTTDDIDGFLHHQHHQHERLPTAKKLPLELAKITKESNEDFQSVICSMGFTPTLFDRAYEEIFQLMRSNTWSRFRSAILEYCGDKEFVQRINEKQKQKKMEIRQNREVLQMFTDINEKYIQHNKNNGDDNETKQLLRSAMMQKTRSTTLPPPPPAHASLLQQQQNGFYVKHHHHHGSSQQNSGVLVVKTNVKKSHSHAHHRRRKSRDDFELNTKANYHHVHMLSINTKLPLPRPNKPKQQQQQHGQMSRSPIPAPHQPLAAKKNAMPIMCQTMYQASQSDASEPLSDEHENENEEEEEEEDKAAAEGSVVIKSGPFNNVHELSLIMPSTSMGSASTLSANNTPFEENESKYHCNADVTLKEDEEISFRHNPNQLVQLQPRLSFIPKLLPAIEKSVTSPTVQLQSSYSVLNMRTPDMTPGGGAAVELPTPIGSTETVTQNGGVGTRERARPSIMDHHGGQYSPSQWFNLAAHEDDDNNHDDQKASSPFDVVLKTPRKSNLRSALKPESAFFDSTALSESDMSDTAPNNVRSTRTCDDHVASLNGFAAYPHVQNTRHDQFKKRTSGIYSAQMLQQQNEALLLQAKKSKPVSPPQDDEDGLPLYITHKRRKSKLKHNDSRKKLKTYAFAKK